MKKDGTREPFFTPGFVSAAKMAAALGAIYGLVFGTWCVQAFLWLRDGFWTPLPISDFLPVPQVSGVGAQSILSWVWNCSIAAPLALTGLAVFAAIAGRASK